MYCTKCGREISDTSNVCSYCGTDVRYQTVYSDSGNYSNSNTTPYIHEDTNPMTVGNYLVMLLLMCIPLVNLVLLCIWAFSMDTNVNKKNFARAYLILILIGLVLSVLLWSVMVAMFSTIIAMA